MPAVLMFGSPEHSADLFHEVPLPIIDPFLYLELDGRRAATVSVSHEPVGQASLALSIKRFGGPAATLIG